MNQPKQTELEKIAQTAPEVFDESTGFMERITTYYKEKGSNKIWQRHKSYWVTDESQRTMSSPLVPYSGNLTEQEIKMFAPKIRGEILRDDEYALKGGF